MEKEKASKVEHAAKIIEEPEDEDCMPKTSMPKPQETHYSGDWLAQSIKQSVSDWKQLLKKSKEEQM